MITKPESWLKRNLPMLATSSSLVTATLLVGSAIFFSKLSDRIDELEEKLNNSTEWLLDEVIAVSDDVKDIRDELDNT